MIDSGNGISIYASVVKIGNLLSYQPSRAHTLTKNYTRLMISFTELLEGIEEISSAKMALSEPALVKGHVCPSAHSFSFLTVFFHPLLCRLVLDGHVFLASFGKLLVDFCFLCCGACMRIFDLRFGLLALLSAALGIGLGARPYQDYEQYGQNSPHVQ